MDNIEGVSPMRMNKPTITAPSMPAKTATVPREESILIPEREESVVSNELHTTKLESVDNTTYADNLLNFTKARGIKDAFTRLANGDNFITDSEKNDDLETDNSPASIEYMHDNCEIDEYSAEESSESEIDVNGNAHRRQEIIEYLADEVIDDPLYKAKLGEVASEMMADDEPLDPQLLREAAMERYLLEKNSGLPESIEDKIITIEEQFADLLMENEELRKELQELKAQVKSQSDTIDTLALALLEMARNAHEQKEEEKKISVLELMIVLMGFLMQEFVRMEHKDGKNAENSEMIVKMINESRLQQASHSE